MSKRKLVMRQGLAPAAVLLLALSMAACSERPVHSAFACEDGREGSVTLRDDKTALVSFHGDGWILFQKSLSETELRYSDGVREIVEHQGMLTIKTGETQDASCRYLDD